MANIILKKSSVVGKVPTVEDLKFGELALNFADGRLYYKSVDNSIQSFFSTSTTSTLYVNNSTQSSSTASGALVVAGGVGVGEDLYVGGQLYVNGISVGYGYTGSRGFTGSIGYTGSQGIQGVTGYTGSQGIQGPIGPSTSINAALDTTNADQFPVFVSATGSNQTARGATAIRVNPSTGMIRGTLFEISNIITQKTNSTSVSTTSITNIDTFTAATFRSARYVVQITQGSNYQLSELSLIHDGTNTYTTEYGIIENNGTLGTISSDISSGSVRLRITMKSSSSSTVKTYATLVTV